MPQPEPAQLISETVEASCADCIWANDDEDLALILAVTHHGNSNHEVQVVTTRTETLKAKP